MCGLEKEFAWKGKDRDNKSICERIFDGFAEQMRTVSLKTVPTAILSRQIACTRGNRLIINLPGKPVAIAVCLSAVFLAVPKLSLRHTGCRR